MKGINGIEKNLDKETKELVELSREMLRISREIREEKNRDNKTEYSL